MPPNRRTRALGLSLFISNRNLAHLGAYDMLQELKAMFSKQAEHELLQTVREFHTCKQEEVNSVSSHVQKMKGYITTWSDFGQPVGQTLAFGCEGEAGRVLRNQKNKTHKAAKGGKGKDKNKMGYAHNNVPFSLKPKTPPPPKKDNPTKDAICHQCGEVGHWRRNCPINYEVMKKKKAISGKLALQHCRLGHISKKRIKKLQHDGLLNSIDIESLGKCVSCLSGKMARKPYSHQVERAKDLLGLIHTDELKATFSKQAEQELLLTMREFHTCKQEEGQSVSSHVLKMKGYIDNLERLGQPVGQNLAVSLILVSLNKDFDNFVQNYNMHGMGKTMNELHAMLKLHEETLPKKDVNPALHAIRAGMVQKNQKNKPHKAAKGGHGKGKSKMGYAPNNVPFAPKPKTPPPPKKDNPAKDAVCHQCGKIGHWRRNYPVYLDELMKKKKLSQGASTSGIFTIELYSFPSKSWIYDTGCGTHIFITTHGLRGSKKLKPGALSLYVGDGHRAAVEAIGTYNLELPSGLVIILNNFHYVPSITRGVISVLRLFDDGFINRFDENNVILVSKNSLVYFMAVPRDCIFEIDMSCSNTNDSSVYAISNKRAKINLDSAYLWHCRLGHISKKRIEKLQ
ncbi:zinc finger, CCHC-type containing protein [Tanacetum coccineum]